MSRTVYVIARNMSEAYPLYRKGQFYKTETTAQANLSKASKKYMKIIEINLGENEE